MIHVLARVACERRKTGIQIMLLTSERTKGSSAGRGERGNEERGETYIVLYRRLESRHVKVKQSRRMRKRKGKETKEDKARVSGVLELCVYACIRLYVCTCERACICVCVCARIRCNRNWSRHDKFEAK